MAEKGVASSAGYRLASRLIVMRLVESVRTVMVNLPRPEVSSDASTWHLEGQSINCNRTGASSEKHRSEQRVHYAMTCLRGVMPLLVLTMAVRDVPTS
ncbi:MAG: hypothetical protein ACJ79J_10110 [Gemmatimonadaceae bacterium]